MRSLWLPSPGAFLRYHDLAGAGPARLFVHGLGCAGTSDWPHVVALPPLAGRRSIVPDLLGFGFSDRPRGFGYSMEEHADTLASLLDHLDMRAMPMIGHSMGGSIAILLAARRPDLVASLVVAEPNLDPGPGFVSGRIVASDAETYERSGHAGLADVFEQAARLGDDAAASYVGSFRRADARALHASAASLIAPRSPTYRALLRSLPVPRGYIHGARSQEVVEGLAESGVAIRCVAAAGHGLMDDNPLGFAEAIASLLAS
jgi:pimeloyl-ACP methyl ester carboxylesterase